MKIIAAIAAAAVADAYIIEGPAQYQHQIELADAIVNETMGELIVGGVEVSPKYKYEHVAGMRSSAGGNSFCGGSLISSEWVLTAAHCLSVAHVSVNTHNKGGSSDGVQAKVLSSIRHPSYSAFSQDYDFALLKIERISTAKATPIALASNDASDEPAGRTATVIGWGAMREGGSSSSVLREVDVDIVSNKECSKNLRGITDRMICAGGIKGEDACQGDSGGPFFVSKNNNPILVGAVSWGTGCARAGLPGVYARVSAVRDWIDSNTGSTAKWIRL